ncbi:hypothetical protein EFS30_07495 [Levilactobacillus parabrevis]|uniref:hypothetical protein n=2 Tax=Levilactobacillus parabrevis TaxID=357278 RepID=UPI0021A6412D|nr:hypothetical protein [Levilactobacillus parabrevis]MCT4490442.1 hypothetical protein [Levilactobacillus parabrevis]
MKAKKMPRWLRDTLSVVGAMSVLLIAYNLVVAKHPDWGIVPVQIVLALIAVGAWSFLSYRSRAKRQLVAKQAAEAAQRRAEEQRQAAAREANNAVVRRQRNQQHRQQPK